MSPHSKLSTPSPVVAALVLCGCAIASVTILTDEVTSASPARASAVPQSTDINPLAVEEKVSILYESNSSETASVYDSGGGVGEGKDFDLGQIDDGLHQLRTGMVETAHDHILTVKQGQSLSAIFEQFSIPQTDLHAIMSTHLGRKELRRIHPGQELRFTFDHQGKLSALEQRPSIDRAIHFERNGERFDSSETVLPIESRLTHSTGQFAPGDSLISIGAAAGVQSVHTTLAAANLLGWDVDFWHDPRPGDIFQLIYDRQYVDGIYLYDGIIHAVEFVNRGKVFRSIRYEAPNDIPRYYTPEGTSNRGPFLRAPLEYTRVSSNFNLKRFHPILKQVVPHLGIDYAAPTGTPVRSVGDGVVEVAGRTRANGKYLVINHDQIHRTKYLHLSSISEKIEAGSTVLQGQVIGTVGMTGLATGPHLHYEFLVNGRHRDPKSIPLERSEPLSSDLLEDFKSSIQPLLAMLESGRATGSGAVASQD